jgi:hypothetical protein
VWSDHRLKHLSPLEVSEKASARMRPLLAVA